MYLIITPYIGDCGRMATQSQSAFGCFWTPHAHRRVCCTCVCICVYVYTYVYMCVYYAYVQTCKCAFVYTSLNGYICNVRLVDFELQTCTDESTAPECTCV